MVSRAAVWSTAEVLRAPLAFEFPAAAEVGTSANTHIYPWMNLKPRVRTIASGWISGARGRAQGVIASRWGPTCRDTPISGRTRARRDASQSVTPSPPQSSSRILNLPLSLTSTSTSSHPFVRPRSSPGQSRRRVRQMAKKQAYVVLVGVKPGVYTNW